MISDKVWLYIAFGFILIALTQLTGNFWVPMLYGSFGIIIGLLIRGDKQLIRKDNKQTLTILGIIIAAVFLYGNKIKLVAREGIGEFTLSHTLFDWAPDLLGLGKVTSGMIILIGGIILIMYMMRRK